MIKCPKCEHEFIHIEEEYSNESLHEDCTSLISRSEYQRLLSAIGRNITGKDFNSAYKKYLETVKGMRNQSPPSHTNKRTLP
jgi:hypothetical protein